MSQPRVGPGRVETIHVADTKGAPMRPVARIGARAGVGLDGDRYALGLGQYSDERSASRDLTLIEAEVIEDLATQGIGLGPGESRRNVMTSGIRLNDLVSRRFRIGTLECRGTRLCEPCTYLAGLVGQPVVAPLVHRGGLRADILADGEISVGDAVVVLAD
jgi:hypothetical protein